MENEALAQDQWLAGRVVANGDSYRIMRLPSGVLELVLARPPAVVVRSVLLVVVVVVLVVRVVAHGLRLACKKKENNNTQSTLSLL